MLCAGLINTPNAQGTADIAALTNAFARGNLMEAQASGQLPPRQESATLHAKRSSRDYSQMETQTSDLRRHYDSFPGQQLQVLQQFPGIPAPWMRWAPSYVSCLHQHMTG